MDQTRQGLYIPTQNNPLHSSSDPTLVENGGSFGVGRKKSLVRPEREKIEPGHRQWHYRTHAAGDVTAGGMAVYPSMTGNQPQRGHLRRGRSILAREEDVHESGLALFKRNTLRRKNDNPISAVDLDTPKSRGAGCLGDIGPGPKNPWFIYCYLLTCCVPGVLLKTCGIRTPEQQRAWREKIGLLSIIMILMAGVGFLTFGFTITVCGKPPNRYHAGSIQTASVIIHGYDYDFGSFKHPAVGTFNGNQNPLFEGNWNAAGNDISFMFQTVNQNCKGFITKASNSSITGSNGNLDWYFPCNIYNQYGTSGVNLTGYESSTNCHITATARNQLASMHSMGQVYYAWSDVSDSSKNLAVFESSVLNLDLLKWLSKAQVNYPPLFDSLMNANGTYNGKDLSMFFSRTNQKALGKCLEDIVGVGFIDTNSIGCVASSVVLYLSLIFIVGVVAIRFGMAVMFAWFFSYKLGIYKNETSAQRNARIAEIENWTSDIYRPAPSQYRPNVAKNGLSKSNKMGGLLPNTSRFTPSENILKGTRPTTAYGKLDSPPYKRSAPSSIYGSSMLGKGLKVPDVPSRSSASLTDGRGPFADNPCPFPLSNVVPQPPPDYEPFGYSLAHTICMVTAYSESVEGLRTTLDSLATTDYPNSHKLILVVADGLVKGAGNTLTTPDICLTMMREFLIRPEDVEPHSYVAIADGHKRHNMAKIYAGFYDYDDATVERSKQQRVPMILVAKCGNPLEANDSKPGNRGKRDSQIILMAFMQKVMFDERMTTFEYEFFNSIWRVTGVSPDRYELVLCVDADTKVFPDSTSRMAAAMINDPEIMGLCGETKIANKAETWVTMIQVFEYYTSHHMMKAFESMFGGVTCLPGCFSMYRIKAPKGTSGYWVPILANPDIVEHYSENVVDTLHKKNLLLLGEDRYLTTLLLKTFPKRKNVFCPSAVCKTVVPDTFRVLLSQRRRWINSTVHNLAELLLVRDLCGTFCFSMQFVVGMELAGTLVLPAAISFTLYLIIISIIPGGPNTTIPLILLAIVLGLPGLLIVITTRKIAYVGWMLVYLISLPVWNGILPTYAFWHFDDFSWGQTRVVTGDKGGNHSDKDGEFDSSHIVMKKWVEFERERRWRNGVQSRDSYYDQSSKRDETRHSMISTSETNHGNSQGFDSTTLDSSNHTGHGGQPRPRYDSGQPLILPPPLSVGRPMPSSATSMATTTISRSSDDMEDSGSSEARLVSPPSAEDRYSGYPAEAPDKPVSYPSRYTSPASPPSLESQLPRMAGAGSGAMRQTNVSSREQNRYKLSDAQRASTVDHDRMSYYPETELSHSAQSQSHAGPRVRGISLTDGGPVPVPEGVRRVPRKRPTSQVLPQNRYSRNSGYGLPPGAAPPQPGGTGGYSEYNR